MDTLFKTFQNIKMNKALKWTLIALPIVVGGIIVYRKLRKDEVTPIDSGTPETKPTDTTPKEKPKETTTTTSSVGFPIKKGSKGAKVKELQNLILRKDPKALPRFGADGDFGSETEGALKRLFSKTSVENQAELDAIRKVAIPTYTSGSPLVFQYQSPVGQVSPFLTLK
jgi:hypothetical protein